MALAAEAPEPLLLPDAEAAAASLLFLLRDLLLALNALDALCISCLGDTAAHRDVEVDAGAGALALALSLGVIGRVAPTGCAGALSFLGVIGRGAPTGCTRALSLGVIGRLAVAAVPLEPPPAAEVEEGEGDASEEDDKELCIDELTVGRRKDGIGLSDAAAAAEDGRDGSELRGLDGGLPVPVPLLLLGRAPSLDRSDGRVAMGGFRCIATQSREICQLFCRCKSKSARQIEVIWEICIFSSPICICRKKKLQFVSG
jgi:hypothetical protein